MSQTNSNSPTQPKLKSDKMLPVIGTGRVTQFHCPCCDGMALEVGKLSGVEVCFCPQCNGFVMDNETCGSLTSTLRASYTGSDEIPKPFDPQQLEIRVSCPACREPMEVHPYYGPGNAVIDSCMHCKLVWFNENELEQIVRAPGLRQAPVRRPSTSHEANPMREREGTDALIDRAFVDAASSLVRAMFG